MITVAETQQFLKKSEKLLKKEDKEWLINYLSENPKSGVLIEGTSGVRKIRWGRSGSGKSGGVRVIYYFHNEKIPLYLLTIFSKNERVNISATEKKSLANLVKELIKYWR